MRTVVDVEGGQHRDIGQAHADDVGGVAWSMAASVLVADGGRGERDQTDEGEVVVLAGSYRGEHECGREDRADGAVVPASGADVAEAAFARERGGSADGDGAEAGEHVHGQHGEE